MALSKLQAESLNLADTYAFTGTVTGAGEITASTTAPSEGGAATTNVVQGLAKAWTRFNSSANTEIDSLNQSSRTDIGTGVSHLNFTNNMNNDDFVSHVQTADTGRPVNAASGAFTNSTNSETTALVEMCYGYSGNSGGVTWAFFDYTNVKALVHGDLA